MDRGVTGETAELVVVDDFDDGDAVSAFDGLSQLVVVDEDELTLDGFDEVGLREDAGEDAVVVEDGEHEACAFGSDFAGFVERGVDVKAGEVAEDHLFDADGATGEEHGGRGVVGRTDHGDVRGPCGCADFFADGMASGYDDGVNTFADGDFLNVRAVADEENDEFVFVALEAWNEGVLGHGPDHEELFDGF
ncbi:MAG: hypothetical protein RIS92_1811 [Verrucomicrobiota bacterium]